MEEVLRIKFCKSLRNILDILAGDIIGNMNLSSGERFECHGCSLGGGKPTRLGTLTKEEMEMEMRKGLQMETWDIPV